MNPYRRYIEPAMVSFACGTKPVSRLRQEVTPLAEGRILEVGFGSGLNLPFYDPAKVERLFALEPSEPMRRRAAKRVAAAPFAIEFLDLPGEQIPLEDQSVDTVLITFTLCTIPGVQKALEGMRRVLKPGARMLFCEHGRAPDAGVAKWQDRLNPVWGALGGGCNLNRDIPALIRQGGFEIRDMDAAYTPKAPRFAGFVYRGAAVSR